MSPLPGEDREEDTNNNDRNGVYPSSAMKNDEGGSQQADRRVTFRRRRLSLPMHHLSDGENNSASSSPILNSANEAWEVGSHHSRTSSNHNYNANATESPESPVPDKAHTFRKRRLSLTQNRQNSLDDNPSSSPRPPPSSSSSPVAGGSVGHVHKRPRRASEASCSMASVNSADTSKHQQPLRPKTMHAGELLAADRPPPSPAVHSNNVLYTKMALPPLSLTAAAMPLPFMPSAAAGADADGGNGEVPPFPAMVEQPKWSKRQTVPTGHDHKLPFPRDIVGTFSCHGVEPVYDSSYEDYELDDDDDDEDEPEDGEQEAGGGAVNKREEDDEDGDGEDVGSEDDDVWGGGKPAAILAAVKAEEQAALQQAVRVVRAVDRPTMAAKINQDRGGVACPYGNNPRTALFAVYDGHGQGGELVSQFALYEIQRRLEKHPSFGKDNAKAMIDTFLSVDEALKDEPLIEPWFSGTTACVALLSQNRLTLANAGDSRAVLARKLETGNWKTINLTEDQNPDVPAEMERILSRGGFVSPSPGPGLSARVWLDSNCTQIGLAMARSIGDHAVSAVGVIAEPVVTYHDIQEDDDFMILASDGVWEFLESEDAVRIVGENINRGATKACQALIEAAAAKWHEEEGEYRDDITAIVVQLQKLWNKPKSSKHQLKR